MFSQTFPLRAAVIIIGICGVLAATPHLQAEELKAPPLIDVLMVPETSPLYPGMYCVASYSILYHQVRNYEGIPQIVAEDAQARGLNLFRFLAPLAEELEQLNATEFFDEMIVLREYLTKYVDGEVWREHVTLYGCKGMTEQWAVLKVPDSAPL